jgi:hypothetical protein
MPMLDLKRELYRFAVRGVQGQGNEGGSVGLCGHWDNELDHAGYCRDDDCKRDRLIQALKDGKAHKLPNGLIVWVL